MRARKYSKKDIEVIISLSRDGKSTREAAEILGLRFTTLRGVIKRYKIKFNARRGPKPKPTINKPRKIHMWTTIERALVQKYAAAGFTASRIAFIMGLRLYQVESFARRNNIKFIPKGGNPKKNTPIEVLRERHNKANREYRARLRRSRLDQHLAAE